MVFLGIVSDSQPTPDAVTLSFVCTMWECLDSLVYHDHDDVILVALWQLCDQSTEMICHWWLGTWLGMRFPARGSGKVFIWLHMLRVGLAVWASISIPFNSNSSQLLFLNSFYFHSSQFLIIWASTVARVWVAITCYRHVTLWLSSFPRDWGMSPNIFYCSL